jgi:hypothetical protein
MTSREEMLDLLMKSTYKHQLVVSDKLTVKNACQATVESSVTFVQLEHSRVITRMEFVFSARTGLLMHTMIQKEKLHPFALTNALLKD